MSISETLGYRHIRFSRTVAAEVQGHGVKVDLRFEANFPLDFRPELYELQLSGERGDGVVTVQLSPAPPKETEILDVGAHAVGVFTLATDTGWIDCDAELEANMTQDRAEEIQAELIMPPSLIIPEPGDAKKLLAGVAKSIPFGR